MSKKSFVSLFYLILPVLLSGCGGFQASKEGFGEVLNSSMANLDKTCVDDSVYRPLFAGTRRLSITEIRNSVRDLLGGITNNITSSLPPESKQGFYSTNAVAMKTSPIFLETIFDASETVVDAAFANATARTQILICAAQTEACARQILEKLAFKAYHKNVTAADVDRLINVYKKGATLGINFEESLKLAVRALLSSPDFLYISIDPKGSDVNAMKDLNDLELASRISYMIWSSVPDDELLTVAREGTLKDNLDVQVRRMLKSPKADSLLEEFAANWLGLEALSASNPDKTMYPNFTPELRADMLNETKMLIREVMINDLSPVDMVNADYSFINERLAAHYGVSGVTGTQFRKVDMSGTPRRGILGHASVLTLTSHSQHTSIIRRGKYIMDRVICQSPPPPPTTVELAEPDPNAPPKSQRERLEEHRANPACFGCHSVMDPMGFLLENFDAVGATRTMADGLPVDTRADFPDGKQFFSQIELASDLAKNITYKQCITRELMTFGLGKEFVGQENCHARKIASEAIVPGKKFSDLVIGIVKSVAFQKEGAQK